jgi:hypothetical protein
LAIGPPDGSRGLSATLGSILLVGTESDPYSLIKQSAQGQTSSGIEFRAANGAIMIRIGGFQAQLNNRVSAGTGPAKLVHTLALSAESATTGQGRYQRR